MNQNDSIECPVADCANGFIDDVGTLCSTCKGTGYIKYSESAESEVDLEWAQKKRSFIAFCRTCGALDHVHVNPEIIEPKYATEACGWYFEVRKERHLRDDGSLEAGAPTWDFELKGELISDPTLIIIDIGAPRDLPPTENKDFWSRTIVMKFMKYGQEASTCPCCGLGVDLLLHDDDYVVTNNGGRIDVAVGKV